MAAERDDKPERQVLIDAIGRMLRLHEGHTFDVLAKRIADEVLSLRSAVERITEVVGQDGKPVSAPCAISGCRYRALHSATAPRRCREGADRDCSPACDEKSRTYCSWKGF